ncbi:MAG TPA: hypothetical protein VI793_11300 [Anaerolineales bacterium]|nr:hypothetical protein [Anaerolineales bacterium]
MQAAERDTILARLDAIMAEVTAIRRALLAATEPLNWEGNLTERLLGYLGTEPLAAYDFFLDWQRFTA